MGEARFLRIRIRACSRSDTRRGREAAFDFELTGTKSPIGAKEEVVPEQLVLAIGERPAGDQAEIRHMLFPLAGVGAAAGRAAAKFPRHGSRDSIGSRAFAKPVQTGPEK